jgi:hypothetical protein
MSKELVVSAGAAMPAYQWLRFAAPRINGYLKFSLRGFMNGDKTGLERVSLVINNKIVDTQRKFFDAPENTLHLIGNTELRMFALGYCEIYLDVLCQNGCNGELVVSYRETEDIYNRRHGIVYTDLFNDENGRRMALVYDAGFAHVVQK